jgi:hypothetical protein
LNNTVYNRCEVTTRFNGSAINETKSKLKTQIPQNWLTDAKHEIQRMGEGNGVYKTVWCSGLDQTGVMRKTYHKNGNIKTTNSRILTTCNSTLDMEKPESNIGQ